MAMKKIVAGLVIAVALAGCSKQSAEDAFNDYVSTQNISREDAVDAVMKICDLARQGLISDFREYIRGDRSAEAGLRGIIKYGMPYLCPDQVKSI